MGGGVTLAVITYFWQPNAHSKLAKPYVPDDVRKLKRDVGRNLLVPHKFICVTDRPEEFADDEEIEAVAIDTTIPKEAGHCVCRLMTYHPQGREIFGADVVFQMDLDTFVLDVIDPIVLRREDLVLWRNPARRPWANPVRERPLYNGSFVLHRCGTMPWLWSNYLEAWRQQPGLAVLKDDQTWLSANLGRDMPHWSDRDGIYRLAREDTPGSGIWGELPENAKLVTFVGSEHKPDNPKVREANPWIAEYER